MKNFYIILGMTVFWTLTITSSVILTGQTSEVKPPVKTEYRMEVISSDSVVMNPADTDKTYTVPLDSIGEFIINDNL